MTVWADPPLSRREARQKKRDEAGAEPVTVSDEELAAAVAAEEAAHAGVNPVVRRTGAGGRRAQWSPSPTTSSFAPVQKGERPQPDDTPSELRAQVVPELTMTRRELRALRERAAASGESIPGIVFLPDGIDSDRPTAGAEPIATEQVTFVAEQPESSSGEAVLAEAVSAESAPREHPPVELVHTEADATAPDVHSHDSDESSQFAAAAPIPELIEPSSADWTFRASRRSPLRQPESASSQVEADAARNTADDVHDSAGSDGELEYIEAELVEDTEAEIESEPTGAEYPPAPEENTPAAPETLSPFDALFRPAASDRSEPATSSEVSSKPYGHWTTQAALDDAAPSIDGFLSRDVGVATGAITTHALVLPSIPESGDQLLAPLTNTGEIMVTGSIDLPRSFGSTGAHPARFDHPDVDALIDDSDREDAISSSAPVRAIRAVSTTSSTRGVIEAPAKPKSRLPLFGGIFLGGIILVVGAFVAAALVFNVF